ncbi:MAG: hypothetical protein LBP38_06825 [Desulfovibrio sp.]|nr:hypothetical protein [Desulfovibrio sp.]
METPPAGAREPRRPRSRDRQDGGSTGPSGGRRNPDAAGGRAGGPQTRPPRTFQRLPTADQYLLPGHALAALDVFVKLDKKAQEAFLAQAGILALCYRREFFAGSDERDYEVIFPKVTAPAKSIVENAARYSSGVQRLFMNSMEGRLSVTPQVGKLMAENSSLWEESSPKHLVELVEAVEFDAAYRSASEAQRQRRREFRGYTLLDDFAELEDLLKHYKAYKRKFNIRGRYELHKSEEAGTAWSSGFAGGSGAWTTPRPERPENAPAPTAARVADNGKADAAPAPVAQAPASAPVSASAGPSSPVEGDAPKPRIGKPRVAVQAAPENAVASDSASVVVVSEAPAQEASTREAPAVAGPETAGSADVPETEPAEPVGPELFT